MDRKYIFTKKYFIYENNVYICIVKIGNKLLKYKKDVLTIVCNQTNDTSDYMFFKINAMKKTIVLYVILLVISMASASCGATATGFTQGFSQGLSSGSSGYLLGGSASSEESCRRICESKGYSNSYQYYSSTGNCFCK